MHYKNIALIHVCAICGHVSLSEFNEYRVLYTIVVCVT